MQQKKFKARNWSKWLVLVLLRLKNLKSLIGVTYMKVALISDGKGNGLEYSLLGHKLVLISPKST